MEHVSTCPHPLKDFLRIPPNNFSPHMTTQNCVTQPTLSARELQKKKFFKSRFVAIPDKIRLRKGKEKNEYLIAKTASTLVHPFSSLEGRVDMVCL